MRCSACGAPAVQGGFCRGCWARQLGHAHRKYVFTEALRAELRRAYAGDDLSGDLGRLQRRTGWPRHAFKCEALRLGLTRRGGRAWTRAEIAYVEESLGRVALKTIARKLGRSVEAVEAKGEALGLSRRVREGYSIEDLMGVFGVSRPTVQRWMARGLFGKVHDVAGKRVTEDSVVLFVRRHYREYDFRRADQLWLKTMLFGEVT